MKKQTQKTDGKQVSHKPLKKQICNFSMPGILELINQNLFRGEFFTE